MPTLSRKAKQFLTVLTKLLIVGGAFYFIHDRLTNNEQLDWQRFTTMLDQQQSFWIIAIIIVLTFLNRFIEILKWQNLANTITPTPLAKATKEVLAAVTAALFTPNGIGEYAAKAMYYSKEEAKTVLFLNLICNGIQLILAVAFGILGLVIFNIAHPVLSAKAVLIVVAIIVIIIFLLFSGRNFTIRGYSIQKLGQKINALPKAVHRKNIILATLRYIVLIHQYYFLFLAFDVTLSYPVLLATIEGTYFLGSSLPTFQFLDFAVKGSVAVFFFGLLDVNEWIVVFVATLIWLLNVVIPVTIGSYYVFRFRRETTLH
ncbi:hypothetical protein DVK85_03950 [Flavobacterium arcticum]|uniref:Uncharacterized protein n=1 Tax=Flavobacterium arcticum TaxID=1784713 RepID=A0A345HA19_9FLAO|nr:lysylphosphatidylglycerol synthase domain-containing protein [Flavobacterium arcticum]AXG73429.1 hypothetical protein DVK85_03950 [Flavobacterium arcticum]KAF2513216.1 hypothetical protein E0W72_02000 [Flavobacterium arcticum]